MSWIIIVPFCCISDLRMLDMRVLQCGIDNGPTQRNHLSTLFKPIALRSFSCSPQSSSCLKSAALVLIVCVIV
jgi:hypothetical protein